MPIRRVTWQHVAVPFAQPLASATGTMRDRHAAIVSVSDGTVSGWGEATPWPAFALGTVADALDEIAAIAPLVLGDTFERARARIATLDVSPATRCALDVALADALARAGGTSLAASLGARPTSVAVNAVIGADAPALAARRASVAVAAGYATLKIKVGSPQIADDVARVAAIRAAVGPDIALRVDANAAWDVARAIDALAQLAPFAIDYAEQPVAAADVDGLARVRRACGVPIAADEGVRDAASARALIDADAVDVLVLKVTTLGTIAELCAIAAAARARGVAAVVTTTFDFGFATAASIALAAALAGDRACGLATADALADDLVDGLPPVGRGRIAVPAEAGLGVAPDERAIERYALAAAGRAA
jgi:o-succinylbenzoate synthase